MADKGGPHFIERFVVDEIVKGGVEHRFKERFPDSQK
jgi:hypothetical protein